MLATYLLTASKTLINDGEAWLNTIRKADPTELYWTDAAHFLQIPLTRHVTDRLHAVGIAVDYRPVFLAICLAGTLAAAAFLGLVVAALAESASAGLLTAALFGTSLHAWLQWNGELYALALGFLAAGLFVAERGRWAIACVLWALAVLSHADTALAAPAFLVLFWRKAPADMAPWRRAVTAIARCFAAGALFFVFLFAYGWLMAAWAGFGEFIGWMERAYGLRLRTIVEPHPIRALRGLVTAYSAGGHVVGEILTGRSPSLAGAFAMTALLTAAVLTATAVFALLALRCRRLAAVAAGLIVLVHVSFNWWLWPTTELYHGVALLGVVALVGGGAALWSREIRWRRVIVAGYVAACVVLNLTVSVLPVQAYGKDLERAEAVFRHLGNTAGGRLVVVTCTVNTALRRSGVRSLEIRRHWNADDRALRTAVMSQLRAAQAAGDAVYSLGRECTPWEWRVDVPRTTLSLHRLLGDDFTWVPTGLVALPTNPGVSQTNPLGWRTADLFELRPR